MADADLQRLESMKETSLRGYVRNRLMGLPSEPPVEWSRGATPEEFLVDAAALSTDETFKARLRLGVGNLLEAWRPSLGGSAAYARSLLYLTGLLGVEGGPEILAELAFRPAVDELVVDGERLSDVALRALLDFPGQAARTDFWEPLTENPRFFDTAFFAFTLQGARPGLQHLGRYLQMARVHGLPDTVVDFRLTHFIRRHIHGHPRHEAALGATIRSLPPEQRRVTEEIVGRRFPALFGAMAPQPAALSGPVYAHYQSSSLSIAVEQGRLSRPADLFVGNHAP